MLFRFRHKTYVLGQVVGQISELLENGISKDYVPLPAMSPLILRCF